MRKIKIAMRPKVTRRAMEKILIGWAMRNDADVKPMGRLVRSYKTKGDNMHWHIRGMRVGMGTVEATYSPLTGEMMVLVHDNRRGTWAGKAYRQLAQQIMGEKEAM